MAGITKIVHGQVRGESHNGQDATTEEIVAQGFTPGSKAHIVLAGWSFNFTFGDHPIVSMGIWLQQAVLGEWHWAQDVNVQPDGSVHARYYCFTGSENRDNPFTFLVNYAVFGE
jgi:hypothetical protein